MYSDDVASFENCGSKRSILLTKHSSGVCGLSLSIKRGFNQTSGFYRRQTRCILKLCSCVRYLVLIALKNQREQPETTDPNLSDAVSTGSRQIYRGCS